jgi:PAS domain S-box-containing protein
MTSPGLTDAKTPERILIVDDNDAGSYAKGRILRQAGFGILEAATGRDALSMAQREAPDLILLDVRLPDMSGIEVCRRIKADPALVGVPVVQMSASFCDDQSKTAGLVSGADAYLTEPIEPGLLVATITVFLRMRRAEQALRERALEWEATFDAITDGIALVDLEGRVRRCNSALPVVLDSPASAIVGSPLDALLPPAEGERSLWAALDSGKRQFAERTVGDRVFSLTVDPVRDSGGSRHGAVCIVRDVTQTKRLDERLRLTAKLESLGVLAGGVAHDFNNLLMGILGNASLALELMQEPQPLERVLRDIVRASERAADLTSQLLAYAGKGRFVVEPVDLPALITGILPLIEASFLREVRLVLDLAAGLPPIRADKTQMEQVVMNLLINAAEASTAEGSPVYVTVEAVHFADDQRGPYLTEDELRGDYVRLRVRDEGVGMSEETLRRIFDPFFTTKFMGRGLGLSAVLGIVRGHKGALRVTSAPGEGTTFELLFPSLQSAPLETPTDEPPRPAPRKCCGRVLVVDDEPVVRKFFRAALERAGYEVLTADGGREALRIFREQADTISAVLLDIVMPGMSGREVLPRLFELRPDIRVVITSGQMEKEVRRDLDDARIAGFIQKPCSTDVLLRKFDAFVGLKAPAAG